MAETVFGFPEMLAEVTARGPVISNNSNVSGWLGIRIPIVEVFDKLYGRDGWRSTTRVSGPGQKRRANV